MLGVGSEIQDRILLFSDQRFDLRRSSPGVIWLANVSSRILLDLLVVIPLAEEMREIPLLLRAATLKLHRDSVLALLALEEHGELLALILKLLDAGLAKAEVAVAGVHEAWIANCAGHFRLSGLRCQLILLI